MDSRERVFLSLNHEAPDRTPRDFWSTAETDAKLLRVLGLADRGALLERFGVDLRYMAGPRYTGAPPATHPDGSEEDVWGVPRVTLYAGEGERRQSYKEVTRSPLREARTVEDILDYEGWPSPDDYDYSVVAEQGRLIRDAGRVACFMGDRLNRIAQFKPAMYLRGVDQALLDMAMSPEIFRALVGKMRSFYEQYLRRILEAAEGCIDILVTGDDFGSQNGMLCSPGSWRELLLPGFRSFIKIATEFGVPVMHHTCGSVREIIPDLIEAGLRILNPVQPGTRDMAPTELKREFGERLCFHGSISIQGNLPFGTPDDVRAEARDRIADLGANGGFIICTAHNLQADTPVENILALIEAYEEFG